MVELQSHHTCLPDTEGTILLLDPKIDYAARYEWWIRQSGWNRAKTYLFLGSSGHILLVISFENGAFIAENGRSVPSFSRIFSNVLI